MVQEDPVDSGGFVGVYRPSDKRDSYDSDLLDGTKGSDGFVGEDEEVFVRLHGKKVSGPSYGKRDLRGLDEIRVLVSSDNSNHYLMFIYGIY